jgi:hypothetical protein
MPDVDIGFLRAQLDRIEAVNRSAAATDRPRVEHGGRGPHDPGMEPRVAKLEADVGHIRSDIGEIKTILGRLAPRIDEMYGRQAALVSQQDLTDLRFELERRPTRRQTVSDIITIVGLIGVVLTIGAKVAH